MKWILIFNKLKFLSLLEVRITESLLYIIYKLRGFSCKISDDPRQIAVIVIINPSTRNSKFEGQFKSSRWFFPKSLSISLFIKNIKKKLWKAIFFVLKALKTKSNCYCFNLSHIRYHFLWVIIVWRIPRFFLRMV